MTDTSKPRAPEELALWRVLDMADATGADLMRAYSDGELSQEEWAETVRGCRGCRWAEGCIGWLAADDGVRHAAPQVCGNPMLFERLVKG